MDADQKRQEIKNTLTIFTKLSYLGQRGLPLAARVENTPMPARAPRTGPLA